MKAIKNSKKVIFSIYIPIAVNAMEWGKNIAFNEGMPRKAGNSENEQSGTVTAVKQSHCPPSRAGRQSISPFSSLSTQKAIFYQPSGHQKVLKNSLSPECHPHETFCHTPAYGLGV